MKPLILKVGGLMGLVRAEYRQLRGRYFGTIERFDGNAKEICSQIVERLWQGDFYKTSLGHYDFFWMRDFGTVCESLVAIGQKDHVLHTLKWAMNHFLRADTVTLCIDKAGRAFNAPAKRSIDALPWLLHCLVVSGYVLNKREHVFLEKELVRYRSGYLDPESGDLLKRRYAEMRDAVFYDRSAYSVALIGRLAKCTEILHLNGFPFKQKQYAKTLMQHYWNGDHFNADRSNKAYSSECALMPFFLNIITDRHLVDATCDYITKSGMNRTYPLQYGENADEFDYRIGMGKRLMPNYTGTTIWTWHATFYLHVLKRYKRSEYQQQYNRFSDLIERHGTYPELVNPDGSWYYVPIYRADPGMVWAALFLEL
ncbi:hypothetical protein H7200_02485 [Candidatus Saccharibacteria bacterium]|nr:hypothetical protein [Candidatus Saccharibacteria bacterium]